MYFQGSNITVRDCYSHHNEDGFFANHDADYILIENCHIAWNGTLFPDSHAPTHNFYFCAKHQMVKNSYLHDPRDGQSWKSRGENTIFAFNWVDEDFSYSIEQASDGGLNTLWLGNLVAKRTTEGLWQGRVLAIGDGTGVVSGTVVAVNNTFVTMLPRDYHVFTFETGTANLMLFNNVFAGPAEIFATHKGQGKITGSNNWLRKGVTDVPEGLENTIYGEDPGFEDAATMQYRPKAGSPLIDAGISSEKYAEALQIVLANAESGSEAKPSPAYLAALEDIKAKLPKYEPIKKAPGFSVREAKGGWMSGRSSIREGRHDKRRNAVLDLAVNPQRGKGHACGWHLRSALPCLLLLPPWEGRRHDDRRDTAFSVVGSPRRGKGHACGCRLPAALSRLVLVPPGKQKSRSIAPAGYEWRRGEVTDDEEGARHKALSGAINCAPTFRAADLAQGASGRDRQQVRADYAGVGPGSQE